MAYIQSPASDASSDLYAEVDTSSQLNLTSRSRLQVASQASDPMYDDNSVPLPAQTKGKRRFGGEDHILDSQKRRKIVLTPERYFSPAIPPVANLPAEVWQHVFLYLTPDDLSRCLRVNRLFHSYLTDLTGSMSIRLPFRRNGLKLIDSEAIWTSARKLFAPNLPRPLAGFTEMHMFQLLGGSDCQACGVFPQQQIQPSTPFDAGPGPGGDVLVVVSPINPLRAGLPYAFCTPDLHYIPATLQPQAAVSIKGTMFKVYSQKHIDDLQQEHQNAMEFGDAAAEEWVKGLPLLGKQQMADAARWERWEAQLPLGSDISKVLREYFRPYSAPMISEVPDAVASTAVSEEAVPSVSATSLPAPPSAQMKHPLPARVVAVPSGNQPSATAQSPPQSTKKEWRPPRNMKEINEAKALRRSDIERRCYHEFQPPLMPNVLQHMESFHAAMQITTPLTDSAWEVLKPRLYAQRDTAEQIEYMREEQMRALQATIPDPAYHAMYSQPVVDPAVLQRQYEAAQAPIRKKLGMYADDLIRIKYKKGKVLTRENCPEFAVEVLLYARNRFLEVERPHDLSLDHMTDESDPWFVSLENMRWLYDQKVKTYTDKYMRELFHCSECKSAGKSYAFEGMIQHYGAKHTSDFSRGNIVVHWQSAEWPDESPLEPCNGVTPDPTMPQKQPKKGAETLDPSQHQPLDGSTPSAQPAYPDHPAYHHGWHANAEPGTYESTGYPSYPQHAQAGYAPYGYPYAQSGTPADPHHPHDFYPSAANPASLYQDQLDTIANVAREIWDLTAGIKGLEESVRVHTILHHVVKRFKSQFGSEPSLDMLTDALLNHDLMRPIKDASGMACMTCISSNLDGLLAFKPYAQRIADYKLYNTSSLITHFKTVHLGNDAGLDYKEDMIELPEDDNIRQLLIAVGMNDEKLGIIAEVFPKLFPNPLPRIGEVKESFKPLPKKETKSDRRASQKKNKKQKRIGGQPPAHLAQGETSEEQSDTLPEAAEDEYDPRRPAFIERGNPGPNSNGKRPHGDGQRQQPSIDLTQLAPETLEALSRLRPSDPEVQRALAGRTERSPSVPRAAGSITDSQGQNRAAFEANRVPMPQSQLPREVNTRSNGRHDRGGDVEPSEDYTHIIRTPASGPYSQHAATTSALSVSPQDHYVRVDSRGQPLEYPRHDPVPYGHAYDSRPGHQDYYSRPEYRMDHPPPVSYAYEPRPETVYVDQYGRPVEVVRVIERHPPPMYDYPPQQSDYYPREDPHARYVYYEQPPSRGPPGPQPGYGGPPRNDYGQHGDTSRYVYDDGRASVPRM
ncbi:hypothetical protein D6C91_09240 [Aureobasidium pullulans]|uniref:F-box domain-containing protein n=1 Tax=Aureobasidium pullulans TaxID=5580 RepID=A0A4S9SMM6_AURPU|nr:hypothetical protein D6C91_09240 [Aureobasidium pullulans]